MKTLTKLEWIKDKDEWHLKHLGTDGEWHTVQEFHDCENIPKFFKGLDKQQTKMFTIEIKLYE